MVISKRRITLVLGMMLLQFPNVSVAGSPIPISGIELTSVFFGIMLLINASRSVNDFVHLPGFHKVFALIPIAMLFSALIGVFTISASDVPQFLSISSIESVLQSLRRLAVPIVLLSLVVLLRDRDDARVAWWAIAIGLVFGCIVYALAREGSIPSVEINSRLRGNYATEFLGEGANDLVVFQKRFAGTTGSPTIFAAYASALVLLTLTLAGRGVISQPVAWGFTLLCFVLIVMTASKSVLAAFVCLAPLWATGVMRGPMAVAAVLGVGILACIAILTEFIPASTFDPILSIGDRVATGGFSSFLSRFIRWDYALDLIEHETWITLFGHGWQAKAVGYHNEILEIIAGFGILFGAVMLTIAYYVIPKIILARDGGPMGPAQAFVVLMIFSSMFQTIMFNTFLMVAVTLWISMTRAAAVAPAPQATPTQMGVVRSRPVRMKGRLA